jgi:putative peptide zinc metalloprotease protein
MGESIFSAAWHRVGSLRPRLRAGVTVQRQMYRGEPWYLLVDAASGRQHRVNRSAYELIGRFDGRASVDRLWALLLEKFGDDAPTQDEILGIVARLGEAGLVQFGSASPGAAPLRPGGARRARRRRAWINPLAVSAPLLDPARLLERLEPAARWLAHPAALAAWAAAVLAAAAAVGANWDALRDHAAKHMTSASYLTLAWILYPVIKGLHELAHAVAVRRWGGEVHEMGITLLFFTPAPYVDASAANAFRDRWQRAAVSAAGIAVELGLAAAAVFVWLEVEPGTLRDVAFVTLFLCGASTLLFNANPLVRFDGYHLLCDVLDLPNLAVRSRAYWIHLALRLLGGAEQASMPAGTRGERIWLLAYMPASLAYRMALALALTLWLGSKSEWLGWLAALLVVAFMIAVPAWGTFRALAGALPQGSARRRAALIAAPAAAGALAFLFAVPLPSTLVVQGVVWPPEQAQVRAETAGFVREVLARDGQAVEPGTPLVELSEPALRAEHESLLWRVQSLQSEQYRLLLSDPAQAKNAAEELARVQADLDRVAERVGHLTVRARAAGRLVLARAEDLPGAFARKGAMLGYVLSSAPTVVRAVVPNESAPLLRTGSRHIEVLLPGRDTPLPARLARELPAASQALPSAALGERGGGRHLVDPADKEGTRTLEPVFLFDVVLEGEALQSLGQRAWVRFALDSEPLGVQSYRRLRQLLLKHFNPIA